MAAAIGLRNDYGSGGLQAAARRSKDGPQARRLLALAAVCDGATRTEGAKIGGVGLQVVRDWVVKFNAQGPDGLIGLGGAGAASAVERRASRRARRDHRERPNSGDSRGRALADRRSLPMDFREIPHRRLRADVEPRAAQDGLSRKLSARPRHHAQARPRTARAGRCLPHSGCDEHARHGGLSVTFAFVA